MEKQEIIQQFPEYSRDEFLKTFLRANNYSLPEIQAQVKRAVLSGDLSSKKTELYTNFLYKTNAPDDIEHRYTGEHCHRYWMPFAQLQELLARKPRYAGGVRGLHAESEGTSVSYDLDQGLWSWLEGQGVKIEFLWESEIGRL